MSDDERMTPASPDDFEQALAFALRFDGRKGVHHGDEFMAGPALKFLPNLYTTARRLAARPRGSGRRLMDRFRPGRTS